MGATPDAIAHLSEKGFDPQFGALSEGIAIQRGVNKLSKEILAGKVNYNR
jgi:ATP-dependent Clp protease ATP-binding subunit ClpB